MRRLRQRFTIKSGFDPRLKFKPMHTQTLAPIVSSEPFPPGVVSFSSGRQQCGVQEYSDALAEQFRTLGAQASPAVLADLNLLRRAPAGSLILLHVEPSILPPGFEQAMQQARVNGAKLVVCFHYLDPSLLNRISPYASSLVQHRDYGLSHPLLRHVPLACPVYSPGDRRALREKYGLPQDKAVIMTAGFASAWKKLPETVTALLPGLGDYLHLQLICSQHYSDQLGSEIARLRYAIGSDNRARLVSHFVPTLELIERADASDLGFVYHGSNTGSVSAVTKQFIAARCPLVVTSSNHASDVLAAEHVPGLDLTNFVTRVLQLARMPEKLAQMRADAEIDYARLNMQRVARQYLEIFAGLP